MSDLQIDHLEHIRQRLTEALAAADAAGETYVAALISDALDGTISRIARPTKP